MSDLETPTLDARTLDGLGLVLDVLLPGTESSPAGRLVLDDGELLGRVIGADPTLTGVIVSVGTAAVDAGKISLASIADTAGEDFERLVFALNAAYYMSRDVRAAIGYPGQRRLPVSEATPDQVCSEALVAPVVARGPIYVEPPV